MVEFGKFDRDGALLDLLIDHAPISRADFAEVVHQEYGYDPATIQGTYVPVDVLAVRPVDFDAAEPRDGHEVNHGEIPAARELIRVFLDVVHDFLDFAHLVVGEGNVIRVDARRGDFLAGVQL